MRREEYPSPLILAFGKQKDPTSASLDRTPSTRETMSRCVSRNFSQRAQQAVAAESSSRHHPLSFRPGWPLMLLLIRSGPREDPFGRSRKDMQTRLATRFSGETFLSRWEAIPKPFFATRTMTQTRRSGHLATSFIALGRRIASTNQERPCASFLCMHTITDSGTSSRFERIVHRWARDTLFHFSLC